MRKRCIWYASKNSCKGYRVIFYYEQGETVNFLCSYFTMILSPLHYLSIQSLLLEYNIYQKPATWHSSHYSHKTIKSFLQRAMREKKKKSSKETNLYFDKVINISSLEIAFRSHAISVAYNRLLPIIDIRSINHNFVHTKSINYNFVEYNIK